MAKKTIKQRAAAIIADTKRYDADTREAISNSLKRDTAADLAVCVERAEAGETIFDLIGEQAKCEQAAAQVVALFGNDGVPDFITVAVQDAIEEASKLQHIVTWDVEKEDFSLRALADLFAVSKMLSLDAPKSSTDTPASGYEKTARLVADLLADPHTPADLRGAIEDYLVELENTTQVNTYTPEVVIIALPLMLEVHEAVELNVAGFSDSTRSYLRQRREKQQST